METELIKSLDSSIQALTTVLKIMKPIGDEEKGSLFIQAFCFLNYKVIYDRKIDIENLLNELLEPHDPKKDRVLKIR